MEERITELEIRIAHQEATLEALNKALVDQQQQIDRLQEQLRRLTERLQAITLSQIARPEEEPPPPHY